MLMNDLLHVLWVVGSSLGPSRNNGERVMLTEGGDDGSVICPVDSVVDSLGRLVV